MAATSPRHTLRTARRRGARLGWQAAAATVLEASPWLARRLELVFGRPTLTELQQSGSFSTRSRDLVREAIGLDDPDWDRVEEEFADVAVRLAQRRERTGLAYPGSFAAEEQTSLLLYGLARLLKPRCIVETGVADGHSTFVLLAALARNGDGVLHSIDIAPDVGILVDETAHWQLHLLNVDTIAEDLPALLAAQGPIDLFFHDSDHHYLAQLFEYEAFADHASQGALLVSDDVDMSYAFDTFCRRRAMRPNYLFDARKVTGMVRLTR